MKTFEEILFDVFVERSPETGAAGTTLVEYHSMMDNFPFFKAVHEAAIEAAKRYSDQNVSLMIVECQLQDLVNQLAPDTPIDVMINYCPGCGKEWDENDSKFLICDSCGFCLE